MRKFLLTLAVIFIFVVSFSLAALATAEVGEMLPDITVKDLNGNEVKISSFYGHYVLVDVWATWCPPCVKAIKGYAEHYSKFTKANVKLVALSVDAKVDEPIKYAADHGLPFTILHDSEKKFKEWGVRGIPTVFLLDPTGKIIFKEVGFDDFATLWKNIANYAGVEADIIYPTLKTDSYKANLVQANFSEMGKNLTLSFFSTEEISFVEKPEVVLKKEPTYANTPVYANIAIAGQKFTVAGVDSKKSGYMDLLYVDKNQNLDLTDDGQPVAMTQKSGYTILELPLEVKANGSKMTFKVTFYSYDGNNTYELMNSMGYESTIKTDTATVKVLLVDGDINGTFTDPDDVLLMDLSGNGIYDSFSTILEWAKVGSPLELGGNTYKIVVSDGGKKISIQK